MGAPLPWPDRYLQPNHHPARDWGAWEVQAIPPEGLRSGAPATLSVEELHQFLWCRGQHHFWNPG